MYVIIYTCPNLKDGLVKIMKHDAFAYDTCPLISGTPGVD